MSSGTKNLLDVYIHWSFVTNPDSAETKPKKIEFPSNLKMMLSNNPSFPTFAVLTQLSLA